MKIISGSSILTRPDISVYNLVSLRARILNKPVSLHAGMDMVCTCSGQWRSSRWTVTKCRSGTIVVTVSPCTVTVECSLVHAGVRQILVVFSQLRDLPRITCRTFNEEKFQTLLSTFSLTADQEQVKSRTF